MGLAGGHSESRASQIPSNSSFPTSALDQLMTRSGSGNVRSGEEDEERRRVAREEMRHQHNLFRVFATFYMRLGEDGNVVGLEGSGEERPGGARNEVENVFDFGTQERESRQETVACVPLDERVKETDSSIKDDDKTTVNFEQTKQENQQEGAASRKPVGEMYGIAQDTPLTADETEETVSGLKLGGSESAEQVSNDENEQTGQPVLPIHAHDAGPSVTVLDNAGLPRTSTEVVLQTAVAEISFVFWLPIRREGEGESLWQLCTGYAVRDYPTSSSALASGFGHVAVSGSEDTQIVTISLFKDANHTLKFASVSFPLPASSTWTTHEALQLHSLNDTEPWGSYNLDRMRVRKDEFIHVHGVHDWGQNFSWNQV